MYLTARVRLYPTPEQARLLIQTIERFNSACNFARENRPSRDTFICARCGLAGPADVIAAKNIAFKATTRWPHAAPVAVASVTSG